MTENKRFQWVYIKDNTLDLRDNGIVKVFNNERLEELLNDLADENEHLKKEKEYWKSSACHNSSFNSILLHELDIAKEQGYTVSDPFKKLMGDLE